MELNIYKIERTDSFDWDEYDSAIVAAINEEDALSIHPDGTPESIESRGKWSSWPRNVNKIAIKLIGVAAEGISRGVICASFNAG